MATSAVRAIGSKLKRKDPLTNIFADVPQMRIIPTPAATQNYIETTNMDSEGAFEENVASFKVGNELAFTLVYHPSKTLHKQLWEDFVDQTEITWRSMLPDGINGWEFVARVSKFEMPLDYTQIALLNGSLKVTGAPIQVPEDT
jgi:predicted secreted protein